MYKKSIKFDPKWSRFRTFLEPLRLLWLPYLGTTGIALLQSSFGIAFIGLTAKIVGTFEADDPEMFLFYMVIFIIYMVTFYTVKLIARHLNSDTDYNVASLLRQYLMDRFISMDNNQVETKGTGRITSIIANGISAWNNLLWFVARRIVREGMSVIFALIYIAIFSRKFFFIAVAMIIVLSLLIYFLDKKVTLYRKKRKDIGIEESRHRIKVFMSKFEILQNDKRSEELGQVANFQESRRLLQRKVNNYSYPMYHLPGIGVAFVRIIIIFIVGFMIFEGTNTIETFVALMGAMGYITGVISRLIDSHSFVQEELVHIEELFDFIDNMQSIKGLNKGKEYKYSKGDISIQNISFGYESKPVFKDFSLDIKGGKKTAFVGESGSGKSTLMKLIAGYLHVDSGDISIDGQSLSETKLKSYYQHIGYLTQEPSVFDGTIMENLTYAIAGKLDEKLLKKVVTLSKCEFIYDFEKGFDTVIGEKGIKLSGGQRQRLAIAKIFIKNPEIILLDEPTSALDSFSEEAIIEAMHNLFKGRTVVIVAHRLQTVKEADEIIVFDKGKVIERGNHGSLVKKKGVYAKMLELQSGF